MATAWTAAQLAAIDPAAHSALPVLDASVTPPVVPGFDLWDLWPLQHDDGRVAAVAGGELWFALSAPALGDPVERHGLARIRLLHFAGNVWRDLGDALPDGHAPGSREWSGSAILRDSVVTLYFTAAGRRGEPSLTYEQRLFETTARLDRTALSGWTAPVESVASDGVDYVVANQREGRVGTIKAFRDPGFFRDPVDGTAYLLFAASLQASTSAFNGAVGVAKDDDGWTLLPPLVTADAVNNELERPHIVVHAGRYHLFWSTQASVFAPGIVAPTGLYGMVADRFAGPYEPFNGSGLVLANPSIAPAQAYSWLVLADLRVVSFVDDRAIEGDARARFGGVPAPVHRLTIDGNRALVKLLAGVEIGGTKTVVLLARDREIVDIARFPTITPAETLGACVDWLAARPGFAAIGIGSFGPLGLNPARADYGRVTLTPKPGWSSTPLLAPFERFGVPLALDTDVAGAALAEGCWGASQGCGIHVYLTIGTGIGAGLVVDGKPVHGLIHPEAGHVRVRRVSGDAFPGICPFHGDCLEGLASGPAIAVRAGAPAETLGADHPVWRAVAAEIAELMMTLILTVSPERIVIGGGVGGGQAHLLPMVRERTAEVLGGYLPAITRTALDDLIVQPKLGDDAGPLGAVALAALA